MRSAGPCGTPDPGPSVTAPDLFSVALELAGAFGDDAALIGGMAVAAWGHVRATEDLDFVTPLPSAEVEHRLSLLGADTEVRHGDREDVFLWVVRGRFRGVPFQVLPQPFSLDWGAVRTFRPGPDDPGFLRVVSLEDLVRLKILAAGPRDLWDVAELVRLYPEHKALALSEARTRGISSRLEQWLETSRE